MKPCILVEVPVMYEAVRPFMDALKTEPTGIPFTKYLVLRGVSGRRLARTTLVCDHPPLFVRPLASLPGEHEVRLDSKKWLLQSPMLAKHWAMTVP